MSLFHFKTLGLCLALICLSFSAQAQDKKADKTRTKLAKQSAKKVCSCINGIYKDLNKEAKQEMSLALSHTQDFASHVLSLSPERLAELDKGMTILDARSEDLAGCMDYNGFISAEQKAKLAPSWEEGFSLLIVEQMRRSKSCTLAANLAYFIYHKK